MTLSILQARGSFTVDLAAAQHAAHPHGGYWPVPDGNGQYWPLSEILSAMWHELRSVPGIHAKNTQTWYGPSYDAAWIVRGHLDAWRLPYRERWPDGIHVPRPFDAEADVAIREAIRTHGGLRTWLVQPGGPFTLADFQRGAIWACLEKNGGMLEVPPGGGKTVIATVTAELGPPGPVLHITKNAVTTQYARAVAQFARCRPFELPAQSQAPQRDGERVALATLLAEYLEWADYNPAFGTYTEGRPHVVVGADTILHVLDPLLGVQWASIVFDESHFFKSTERWTWTRRLHQSTKHPTRTRSYAAWALSQKCARNLVMTGTPQPDRRQDWWGQMTLCSDGWEDTSGKYDKRYCDAHQGEHGWDARGATNTEEFVARKDVICFTVPQAVVDAQLPPRRVAVQYVSPATQDKTDPWFRTETKRLAQLAHRGDLSARGLLAEIEGMEAAARKRSATAALVEDHVRYPQTHPDSSSKGKVVVLTGRHADCWELADDLRTSLRNVDVLCGVRARDPQADQRLLRLNSKQETVSEDKQQRLRRVRDAGFDVLEGADRQAVQDAYMRHPGPCVLVATGQAWGTGLDLHDSDLLVIVYLPDSPGDLEQWMRRVQRLGMTRPCLVVVPIAEGTCDERRAGNLIRKIPDIAVTTGNDSLADVRDAVRGTDEETSRAAMEAIDVRVVRREGEGAVLAEMDAEMALWESALTTSGSDDD